jgi:hypothetical protein
MQRNKVSEITLDMVSLITKKCFPNATRVTDRFDAQKLALKLQENTVDKLLIKKTKH